MKLGLIADIHEHNENLQWALELFHGRQVEPITVMGDLFEMGRSIEQTCRLLAEAGAVGVWGNHDFGLCVEPRDAFRARYSPEIIDFMTSLRPHLEIDGCYFSHIEPWLNPELIADLWNFDGLPDNPTRLQRTFAAVPHRLMFAGHFHRWLLATPFGTREWNGESSVRLVKDRYFVMIAALCEGSCAILDTQTSELIPFNEAAGIL